MPGRQAEDAEDQVRDQIDAALEEAGDPEAAAATGVGQPDAPVMPAPPFPTFRSRPTLPHQVPGVGFESGRDSRAR